MNRHLYGFLIFLAILFIGDRIISTVMLNLLEKSKFKYMRMYNKEMDSDIVTLGNSRGNSAFQEKWLRENSGKNISNISHGGLKTRLALTLLEDYIDIHEPKLIIFEVTMLFDNPIDSAQLRSFKIYSPFSERMSSLVKEKIPKTYYAGKIFNLTQFNSVFYLRNLYFTNKSDIGKTNKFKIGDDLIQKTIEMPTIKIVPDPECMKYFVEFINSLDPKKTKVKLIVGPYLPEYKAKMEGYDEAIALIENQTKLKVKDYSDIITDKGMFADRVHNNNIGAEFIGKIFIEDGLFE